MWEHLNDPQVETLEGWLQPQHKLLQNLRNFIENNEFLVKLVEFISIEIQFYNYIVVSFVNFAPLGFYINKYTGAIQGNFTKMTISLNILIKKFGSNMQIS